MRKSRRKQTPEQPWDFRCGHTCVLPEDGTSNKFANWKNRTWRCAVCEKRSKRKHDRGEGKLGLLGRMTHLLQMGCWHAEKKGYLPPDVSREEMVEMWHAQKGFCVACDKPLLILKAHFDHDHNTGESRGFVHPYCNKVEGQMKDMSEEAILKLAAYCIDINKRRDKFKSRLSPMLEKL